MQTVNAVKNQWSQGLLSNMNDLPTRTLPFQLAVLLNEMVAAVLTVIHGPVSLKLSYMQIATDGNIMFRKHDVRNLRTYL